MLWLSLFLSLLVTDRIFLFICPTPEQWPIFFTVTVVSCPYCAVVDLFMWFPFARIHKILWFPFFVLKFALDYALICAQCYWSVRRNFRLAEMKTIVCVCVCSSLESSLIMPFLRLFLLIMKIPRYIIYVGHVFIFITNHFSSFIFELLHIEKSSHHVNFHFTFSSVDATSYFLPPSSK